MLAVFIALAFSTALLMRLENNRRDKKALTNPEYTAGDQNFDEMSGLRYEITSSHSGQGPFTYFSKPQQRSNRYSE